MVAERFFSARKKRQAIPKIVHRQFLYLFWRAVSLFACIIGTKWSMDFVVMQWRLAMKSERKTKKETTDVPIR